jgi:F1F0 ATPase subunit 2
MSMLQALSWVATLFGGMVLGVVFFGGLWWTVRRGIQSAVPAGWFAVSWLIRSSVVLGGFYSVSRGEWRRLLACLLGFWLARWLLLRILRTPGVPPDPPTLAAPT